MPVSHTKIFSTISSWPLPFAENSQPNGRSMHLPRLSKICNIVLSFYSYMGRRWLLAEYAIRRFLNVGVIHGNIPQTPSQCFIRHYIKQIGVGPGTFRLLLVSILSFTHIPLLVAQWMDLQGYGCHREKAEKFSTSSCALQIGRRNKPPIFASYFYQNAFFVHQQKYRRTIYIFVQGSSRLVLFMGCWRVFQTYR